MQIIFYLYKIKEKKMNQYGDCKQEKY